jgi:hypothetical protein
VLQAPDAAGDVGKGRNDDKKQLLFVKHIFLRDSLGKNCFPLTLN